MCAVEAATAPSKKFFFSNGGVTNGGVTNDSINEGPTRNKSETIYLKKKIQLIFLPIFYLNLK